MKLETTDIYFSAYLMAKGVNPDAMNIQNGGRREKIIFIFNGNGKLDSLSHAFQTGKATVNPIDLKKSILHLKDMMFDALRTYKEERRHNYAHKQSTDRGRKTGQRYS